MIVTIAALGVALYTANTALLTSRRQLEELTGKTGLIPIDDSSLVYVRPLHRPAPMVFSYQLAIPASKRFKLIIGEGVGDSLDILNSTEISGPRSGFSNPPQRTISIYLQKTETGWYVGYVYAGGSGYRSIGNRQLDWMEHIDKVATSWNPPPGIQREVESYDSDQTIQLLVVGENDPRSLVTMGQQSNKNDSPRKFAIWLEPIIEPKSLY